MKVILNRIEPRQSDDLLLGFADRPLDLINSFHQLHLFVSEVNGAECFVDKITIDSFTESARVVFENNSKFPFHFVKRKFESTFAKYNRREIWNDFVDNDAVYFKCSWNQETYSVEPVNGQFIAYIAEYLQTFEDDIIVFCVNDVEQVPNKRFTILKDNPRNDFKAEVININCTDLIDEIRIWLNENDRRKVFKANPKHGMNGTGEKHGEAKLLCRNSAEAQVFLDVAIKAESGKDLYAYDQGRGKFIVFKNDNFKVFLNGAFLERFHAYHVNADQENTQVPQSIIARLRP